MAEFISTFITGFQEVVKDDLQKKFPKCKILNVFDGLLHYQYNEDSRNLEKISYFNNTFFVLKTFEGKTNFSFLVDKITKEKKYFLINKGTFRIRFSKENQFVKVDKSLVQKSENFILKNSKLKIDRVNPSTEIWFTIRKENFSFCGQLISKREFTEKNLNKGELRPEIAYLICAFANIKSSDVILDSFCGFSSIPIQIAKKFNFTKLYISDIDKEKIEYAKTKKNLQNQNIMILVQDAFSLQNIQDNSISLIITDPPWGFYEEIQNIEEFYTKMFISFNRILTQNGRMIILSAKKEEIENAASKQKIKIQRKLNTLVNGKKASIYEFIFDTKKPDMN